MPYQNIHRALKLCEYTNNSLPDFPIQYLRCLITIACSHGISVSDVSTKMRIPLSTASRIINALGNNRQVGKPYNLVHTIPNPSDIRKKSIFLTQKGKDFIKHLETVMASEDSFEFNLD